MVDQLETTYGARLETMHEQLDLAGMQGKGFFVILLKLKELFGIPEAQAGIVARTYHGFEAGGPADADVRAFAEARRKQRFPVPKGWQPWFG